MCKLNDKYFDAKNLEFNYKIKLESVLALQRRTLLNVVVYYENGSRNATRI